MHTSATVRRVVERVVANADCSRFRAWSCSFDGLVKQGDLVDVEIQHIAMSQGSMVISVRAYNSATRDKVLEAEANVEQAPTAYLFCGQGSQEKGMGRALYESNPAARMVWDQGDRNFLNTYGELVVTHSLPSVLIQFKASRY
jgi:fatty acid synthase subunit beta